MVDRRKVLIVDDEEVNRKLLANVFHTEYDIIEAENGVLAIEAIAQNSDICLILLDLIMPVLDGVGVLEYMKKRDLIKEIPVIMITNELPENSEYMAYSFEIADVIHKPFFPDIVEKRSKNIIELYDSRHHMERTIEGQKETIKTQEKLILYNSEHIINAMSSMVEFRSGETGDHIRRVKYLTRIMLKYMQKYFPDYGLTSKKCDIIARASTLHDIGKIGIPDNILLKPGRLTPEEFEIMKTHTTVGCKVLEKIKEGCSADFYQYCYEICRHHHERWDGNGYPDHLAGEQIPISAQIVSIVDVYDALVSKRCYKEAYRNSVAYQMILDGECGVFSPDIIECFCLAKEDFFNIVEVIGMFEFS